MALTLAVTMALAGAVGAVAQDPAARTLPESETGLYVVHFHEDSLARYKGGVEGMAATNPGARGERRLDARSEASRTYLGWLGRQQDSHIASMEAAIDRQIDIRFRYRAAGNGIAAAMTREEAEVIAKLAVVKQVVADYVQPLHTDRGPIWIGAPSIWDGSATAGNGPTKGEGVIVGIIDTGVNMDHPSFSDSPPDGHIYTNPFGAGVYVGDCDQVTFFCNEKLIGAHDFADGFGPGPEADGPEDDNGHGSHTASTAAGNDLDDPDISGVAPHANVITYDACYTNAAGQGLCPFAATSAAADQAVLDGVHAINYSIGGGNSPWGGDIDTFFLDAVTAGIFVSASAGNSGPGPSTTSHIGPWVATIGASTHDRVTVENELENMSGGVGPPGDMTGASRTGPYGPAPIVYAGDFSNGDPDPEQCLTAFPGGTWTGGEIVVCDRGAIARVLKCANVAAGGAAGCVLSNVDGSGPIVADPHVIPATHIEDADGDALKAWLASGSGHMAEITGGMIVTDPAVGDIMAGFSSRGPASIDVIKPDVTNPGVSIFAAVNTGGIPGFTGDEFGLLSGTSMSSPHTAGSGALIAAVHPGWTSPEIKSALMMTAVTTDVFKEDGTTPADPFDVGAGRVDLTEAAEVSFVLDETETNFLNANPLTGGDPRTLNLPSFKDSDCDGNCQWQRTLRSVAAGPVGWTVTVTPPPGMSMAVIPSAFTLGADPDTQVITVLLATEMAPQGSFAFGTVTFTPDDGSPTLHMPVAVTSTGEGSLDIFTDGFESGDISAWN